MPNTYEVLSNLKHNGSEYKAGDTIEGEGFVFEGLVRGGVLREVGDSSHKEEEPKAPEAGTEVKTEETKTEESTGTETAPQGPVPTRPYQAPEKVDLGANL